MFERLKIAAAAVPGQHRPSVAPEQAAPMAAAMLLLEVAWADQNITDAELEATREAIQSMFGSDQRAGPGAGRSGEVRTRHGDFDVPVHARR